MTRTPTPRLITIPFSHFCEKARWALDRAAIPYREEGHLPFFSHLATRPHRGRSVPVLVTADEVLRDSTDILAWIERQPGRTGTLYPEDAAARAEVLALEDHYDRELGPHVRRIAYLGVFADAKLTARLVREAPVPRYERAVFFAAKPLAIGAMKRGLKLTPEGGRRSQEKVRAIFAAADARLATSPWLSGARFGAADLTFAALAGPILFPPEAPVIRIVRADVSPELQALSQVLADSRAGVHALRCYRELRRATTVMGMS